MDDMELCRFNLACTAIEKLRQYLDLNPSIHDTMGVIEKVHNAIHQIDAIEFAIKGNGSQNPFERKDVKSAFQEIRDNAEPIFKKLDEIKKLIYHNGDILKLISEIHDGIANAETIIMKKDKFLKRLSNLEKIVENIGR